MKLCSLSYFYMNFELCLKGSSLECSTKPSSKAPCKRTQHCWMSYVKSGCTPCCMVMQVVGSCCAKVETGQTLSQQLPTFLLFLGRRSVAQHCWGHAGALPMVSLERASLMGCILSTMHCNSQHCWELLHLFAWRNFIAYYSPQGSTVSVTSACWTCTVHFSRAYYSVLYCLAHAV